MVVLRSGDWSRVRNCNEYLAWPGFGQVFRVERNREELRSGKNRSEVAYGLTSLRPEEASAAKLLELQRGHWGIEMGCTTEEMSHWLRTTAG